MAKAKKAKLASIEAELAETRKERDTEKARAGSYERLQGVTQQKLEGARKERDEARELLRELERIGQFNASAIEAEDPRTDFHEWHDKVTAWLQRTAPNQGEVARSVARDFGGAFERLAKHDGPNQENP